MGRGNPGGCSRLFSALLVLCAAGQAWSQQGAWAVADFDRVAHERRVASWNQPAGSGLNYADLGNDGYAAEHLAISGDGQRLWFVLYDHFPPAGIPRHQLWSMMFDGSNPQGSAFDTTPRAPATSNRMRVRTSVDGSEAILDNEREFWRVSLPGATATRVFNFEDPPLYRRINTRLSADSSATLAWDDWNQVLASIDSFSPSPAFTPLLNRAAFELGIAGDVYQATCGRDGALFVLAADSQQWLISCDYPATPTRFALWRGQGTSLQQVSLPFADNGRLYELASSRDGTAFVACIDGSVVGTGEITEAQCFLQRGEDPPVHLGEPPIAADRGFGEAQLALSGNGNRAYFTSFELGLCNGCTGILQDLDTLQMTDAGGGFIAGGGDSTPELHFPVAALSDDGRHFAGLTDDGAVYVRVDGEQGPADVPVLDAIWQRYDPAADTLRVRAHVATGAPLPERIYEIGLFRGTNPRGHLAAADNPLERAVGYWGGGNNQTGVFSAVPGAPGWYEQDIFLNGRLALLDQRYQLRLVAVASGRHRASLVDMTVNPFVDFSPVALAVGIERQSSMAGAPDGADSRSYRVTVSNTSIEAANPVNVSIPAPAGLLGLSWTCQAPSGCSSASGNGAVAVSLSLQPTEFATLELTGTLDTSAAFLVIDARASTAAGGGVVASGSVSEGINGIGLMRDGFE
ncbi:MAG: hypothetical protein R3F15_15585 [Lysobacterales bacterium]